MHDLPITPPLFKEKVFDDPSIRALSRVGVIDVGSNSVRLVVFDGAARSPAYFFNEKIMCGLGAGLGRTGHLNPQGRDRALAAIHRFRHLAKAMGISELTAVATAAVRDATDGKDFCDDVFKKTGQHITVIPGEEEARLSAQGVLTGWPGAYGLVCDIGGASMEMAEIGNGHVGKCATSNLGPLKLMELSGGKKERNVNIKSELNRLSDILGPQHNRLFLVGGSWRALARIDMERRDYPLHVLHEYRMDSRSVKDIMAFIKDHGVEDLGKQCSISASRMALVPYAAEVLAKIVSIFKPKDIAISSYGIREGMLYEKMPTQLRNRDPLIEACRFAEAKDARVPGFGSSLYKFVRPLFQNLIYSTERLLEAACLLHDVSWRAHPDYRHETCFDYVTRANLGGLKHSERVFLGLALLYRYKNHHSKTPFDPLIKMLPKQQKQQAEILGKAMRLGAMLWIPDQEVHAELQYAKKAKKLTLSIEKKHAPLIGEVAISRLNSLANSLEATAHIETT